MDVSSSAPRVQYTVRSPSPSSDPAERHRRAQSDEVDPVGSSPEIPLRASSAAPFEPVPDRHRTHRHDRDGEEHAGHAVQLRTGQNGEDHGQRMQVDAAAQQARIDHVVLDDPEHGEEPDGPQRQNRGVERPDQRGNDRQRERARRAG